jgi:hypothetical protein
VPQSKVSNSTQHTPGSCLQQQHHVREQRSSSGGRTRSGQASWAATMQRAPSSSCRQAASSSRGRLVVTNVAVPSKPPAFRTPKRSKVELIKEKSDYLRHPLMQELVDEKTFISDDAVQLMKFHGSYMQDHREKRAFGSGKFYQFMMRTRQPAGLVTNQLYLVMDDLADLVRQ